MRELLEAGVHFGHQTKRWNPKMKPFIFGARNGIYILDLQQTVRMFRTAYDFITDTVANNKSVLFVGTKDQAREYISLSNDPDRKPLVSPCINKGCWVLMFSLPDVGNSSPMNGTGVGNAKVFKVVTSLP